MTIMQHAVGFTNGYYRRYRDKGYFAGGQTPTVVANGVSTVFSTETSSAVLGTNLSQARWGGGSSGTLDKGYIAGGAPSASAPFGTLLATTDRTVYSSESTAAVTGANLTGVRLYITGAGNQDKGFYSGGITPTQVATSERLSYDSESCAVVAGAALSQARYMGATATGNSDKGFWSGGLVAPATYVATADRITYSTEVRTAVTGANLSQVRWAAAGVGNEDKGFISGGTITTPAFYATTDRNTYSTESTAAVSGANLSQARWAPGASGDLNKGFFVGGMVGPTSTAATGGRTTYSTEVHAAVAGVNLPYTRGWMSSL